MRGPKGESLCKSCWFCAWASFLCYICWISERVLSNSFQIIYPLWEIWMKRVLRHFSWCAWGTSDWTSPIYFRRDSQGIPHPNHPIDTGGPGSRWFSTSRKKYGEYRNDSMMPWIRLPPREAVYSTITRALPGWLNASKTAYPLTGLSLPISCNVFYLNLWLTIISPGWWPRTRRTPRRGPRAAWFMGGTTAFPWISRQRCQPPKGRRWCQIS